MSIKLGIIGLGEMGGGMMTRLLLAGAKSAGYNRTKSKAQAFIDKGMAFADSPHELVEMCDIVISIVSNNEALVSIASGPKGILSALKEGKIWIEASTVAPHIIQALGERAAKTGGTLIDGAVLGSTLTIEQGKLVFLLAGDEAACEKVTPELLKIGPKVRRVGEIGHAKVMKVAVNLNLPVQILALSEGLLLAEKSGIPREVALEVMLGGVIASPMLAYRAPFILNMPEKAWFDVGMMQKDVNLALELAEEVGVPLPSAAVANQVLTSARALGFAEYDFAVLFFALAHAAGINASP